MCALKKGDWIRMTKHDGSNDYKSGDVLRTTEITDNGVMFTDNDGDSRYAYHESGRFEPWTPKVGERVRVTEKANSVWAGEGEVLEFIEAYDTYRLMMLTGCWARETGCFTITEIEPLTVTAKAQPAEQDAPAATLTIQAGKFYKTRDGRKVGPMVDDYSFDCVAFIEKSGDGRGWSKFGVGLGLEVGEDLIAEWQDVPAAPLTNVAATVDAINDEYGPVVAVTDRDNDTVGLTVSPDASELHEELDAVIAKLKKIRKLQREIGLIAA